VGKNNHKIIFDRCGNIKAIFRATGIKKNRIQSEGNLIFQELPLIFLIGGNNQSAGQKALKPSSKAKEERGRVHRDGTDGQNDNEGQGTTQRLWSGCRGKSKNFKGETLITTLSGMGKEGTKRSASH